MPLEPNRSDIERHLELLVSPWRHKLDARLEFRALKDGAMPFCWISTAEPDAIEEAIDKAVANNEADIARNIYVTVNPISPLAKNAVDHDVLAAYYVFADADNAEAAKRLYHAQMAPSFFVLTGQHPQRRAHAYWRFEGTDDLVAWRKVQKGIQAHFGTDSVHNPSRILRLAGTVSWPSRLKIKRGYVSELTRLWEKP